MIAKLFPRTDCDVAFGQRKRAAEATENRDDRDEDEHDGAGSQEDTAEITERQRAEQYVVRAQPQNRCRREQQQEAQHLQPGYLAHDYFPVVRTTTRHAPQDGTSACVRKISSAPHPASSHTVEKTYTHAQKTCFKNFISLFFNYLKYWHTFCLYRVRRHIVRRKPHRRFR